MCGYLILVVSLLTADYGAESLWVYFEVKKVCLACAFPQSHWLGYSWEKQEVEGGRNNT